MVQVATLLELAWRRAVPGSTISKVGCRAGVKSWFAYQVNGFDTVSGEIRSKRIPQPEPSLDTSTYLHSAVITELDEDLSSGLKKERYNGIGVMERQ
eukprot:scaffold3528_cov82-Cyclotella_meneghiniana.AAC.5